ncbi:MAG TPA: response regulator, partial [Opitutaceae bacterium]
RIIGTVQDITARREAEFALRESQAEARKLSLVAAKTDSPVLIGSPDGKIEWANEAFCRVMEYSLEEVIGKNPAHFMVGPETNPRTIARIRAAMARGTGISTDVVNYSKSGRKYHLHIEVQPVRGASGQIENFIAVETDITSRVETEQQLRRAKQEADEASRAKSEFLASMSHEIRTPMNGVIGMTSLLMETTLSLEQRDFVNTIRTSGEALLTIINDILDFSKIESGKMELERAPFELPLCIEEALDLFALQASSKKLELGYYIEPDVPSWIMGDITRLRQVIVNLVNNAVKFTPSGSISIEVRRAHREPTPLGFDPGLIPDPSRVILEVSVRDSGIGIPADRLDRLFKAFSQVDSSTTRKYGGTGLGLAICQRLCQLMGGGIRVESHAGEGSAFIFTIQTEAAPGASEPGLPIVPEPVRRGVVLCIEDHPVTQARLRSFFEKNSVECLIVATPAAAVEAVGRLAEPPALLVIDVGDLETISPFDPLAKVKSPRLVMYPFGQTAPAAPTPGVPFGSISKPLRSSAFIHAINLLFQTSATADAASTRTVERPVGEDIPLEVLLAEDNVVNQKVALRFLERLGYRADAVANGLEAVTTLENRRYDLVLMDVQMPEMDGYEATRQIRARLPQERQPKIIALTANAMQGDRELALAAGMDDHISKPVKMHEIAAAIRRHFGKPAPLPADRQYIG